VSLRVERKWNSQFIGLLLIAVVLALTGCDRAPSQPDVAMRSLSTDALMKHIRTLSSDAFEGRGPGSKGEQLTIEYLQGQFRGMGLEPGNPNGSYLQSVPLVGITPDPDVKLTFSGHGRKLEPKFQKDFVAWTKRVQDSAAIDADMIFVGYGVRAPEFQWDDFKGTDIKGKVIVVLINDPPVPDERIFGGKAMTYYGRWTYKFEKAAELGAAGCFIIHEAARAGYPWEVVRNSWSGEQFDLSTPDKNMGRVAIEGWISGEEAEALFKLAGKNLAALKKAAISRDFRPVQLGVRATVSIKNTLRTVDSHNVMARLTGSDPKLKDEYVIYTAHWDHFGIGPEVNGERIYHGARDNGSGTAALIEIARAFKQLKIPPRRSLLFLAVTAEEQGLLGSRYYAGHPFYPLARTAAVINMDALNVLGRTRDIVMIGRGSSTLDEIVEEIASEQGRTVRGDPEPEKGYFYRSDHLSFAIQGVPAFDPHEGIEYIDKPAGWGLEMRQRYTLQDYHKPSDTIKDYWDLTGLVQDCQLYLLAGYRVANDPKMPEWKPGAEFKAKREASLRQAGPGSR
jgi:Zn-dependent M28 family amino/carboxypeptidase